LSTPATNHKTKQQNSKTMRGGAGANMGQAAPTTPGGAGGAALWRRHKR